MFNIVRKQAWLSVLLSICLMDLGPMCYANAAQANQESIRIVVRRGDGSAYDVRNRNALPVEVQIVDGSGQPAAGATVRFSAVPGPRGASISFAGQNSGSVTADRGGFASPPTGQLNGRVGDFLIRVTAEYRGSVASRDIEQRIVGEVLPLKIVYPGTAEAETAEDNMTLKFRVVQGEDPAPGADVSFEISSNGPASASLASATARADRDGWVTSPVIHPNNNAGSYKLMVTANFEGALATQSVFLKNGAQAVTSGNPPKKKTNPAIWVLLLAGAAGGAAAGALGHGSKSTSTSTPTPTPTPTPPPPISVTVGAPGFGRR